MNNVKSVIVHSLRLGIKDLKVFTRDRMMLASFIVMPIFMMIMMGFIFPTQNSIKNAPLGVVNLDRGAIGTQIASAFERPLPGQTEKMFEIAYPKDQADAVNQIKEQTINGAIIIPEDFSAKIMAGEQATITIVSDQSNPQLSAMLSGVLDGMMSSMSTQMGAAKVASMGVSPDQAIAMVKPFTVETQGVVPGEPNYFQFMAPGLMAMTIMMSAMIGLAGSISREREQGTLDGILSAPISRLSIILGKSFSQVVTGLAQATLILILAILIFGVVVYGNYGVLALLLLLTVFSFIGIGIMISAIASEQQTAMMIMMTITFPMLFLSGALFPIEQMPTIIQGISKVLPLTYAVEALRKCIVLGTGINGMLTEIWVMLGFGVVFTAIAIPVFRRVISK